jgi:hypothetical protein
MTALCQVFSEPSRTLCARNLWTFVRGPSVTSGEPPFGRERCALDSASRPRRCEHTLLLSQYPSFRHRAFVSSMNFNVVLCTRSVRSFRRTSDFSTSRLFYFLDTEPAARTERRVVAGAAVTWRRRFAVERGTAGRRSAGDGGRVAAPGAREPVRHRWARVRGRGVARSDSKNDVASPLGATGMRGGWMILLFDLGTARVPMRHVRPV